MVQHLTACNRDGFTGAPPFVFKGGIRTCSPVYAASAARTRGNLRSTMGLTRPTAVIPRESAIGSRSFALRTSANSKRGRQRDLLFSGTFTKSRSLGRPEEMLGQHIGCLGRPRDDSKSTTCLTSSVAARVGRPFFAPMHAEECVA